MISDLREELFSMGLARLLSCKRMVKFIKRVTAPTEMVMWIWSFM